MSSSKKTINSVTQIDSVTVAGVQRIDGIDELPDYYRSFLISTFKLYIILQFVLVFT